MKIDATAIKSVLEDEETITIPKSTYESLLGNKLVYDIGTKLTKLDDDGYGIDNIIISDHVEVMYGRVAYEIKSCGNFLGEDTEIDIGKGYLTTEYGLADYKPVKQHYKIISVGEV